MAITFLGYIDSPEEMTGAKRRCLYGCDSEDDVANLPTTQGLTLPGGAKTAAPAPFSYALVPGSGAKVMKSDVTWGDL